MFLYIFILLLVAEAFGLASNFPNRLFKDLFKEHGLLKEHPFLLLLGISVVASVFSNLISFPTIYYLGKTQNIIILQCTLIVCSVVSAMLINRFVIKEKVHTGSYITMFFIVVILIAHNILTKPFYDGKTNN
jgi:hypothetical protein